MPQQVSDSLSNTNEQVEQAAKAIGRSAIHRKVFEAIYKGKQRVKSADEIARRSKLTRKQVLTSGKRLASRHIVEQVGNYRDTSYRKIDFFHTHKHQILSLAGNAKKLAALPTKRRQTVSIPQTITLRTKGASAVRISIDDVQSFSKVKKVNDDGNLPESVSEKAFKEGVQRIICEGGQFTDWGGERNDLFTTRLRLNGKRRAAAFGFKGPGKRGKLVPAKMGKNGDQIQRLFQSTAEAFFVQYWQEIDESVLDQMRQLAIAKSLMDGHAVWYGIIDGQDSYRLYRAYRNQFSRRRAHPGRRGGTNRT
jgi:hypothetical protein